MTGLSKHNDVELPANVSSAGRGGHLSSVLIVDDEPGICNFVQKGLVKHFG